MQKQIRFFFPGYYLHSSNQLFLVWVSQVLLFLER